MTTPLDIIQCLLRLDELAKASRALGPKSTESAGLAAEIEALRQRLPTAILRHWDHRQARRQPAIAAVRRRICGACHISMPRSKVAELHTSGGSIGVCENCGVFIYLDASEEDETPPTNRK